jgi:large subunit ribosomal protein L15
MVDHKRKKKSRMRGSHTHGGGAKKKRRGAGHRGGRGRAGTGKRADQKKPAYWRDLDYFSGPPFKSRMVRLEVISIQDIEIQFDTLLNKGIIKEEQGVFVVDLTKKPTKLVSQGKPSRKYKILISQASLKAKEKIQSLQGTVQTEEDS